MTECEYCSFKKREAKPILKQQKDEFTVAISSAFFDKKERVMLGIFHRSDFDDIQIKYCPMCGRNFAGDNQMNLF